MWRVRAEIRGEFVVVDDYDTFEEASKVYDKRMESGYYDSVDMWKLED